MYPNDVEPLPWQLVVTATAILLLWLWWYGEFDFEDKEVSECRRAVMKALGWFEEREVNG